MGFLSGAGDDDADDDVLVILAGSEMDRAVDRGVDGP